MAKLIKHTGIVSAIENDEIVVDIQRISACDVCRSKSACMTYDSKTQQIRCKNQSYDLKIGDTVTLVLKYSFGMYAAMLAFTIPLLLFIISIIVCHEIFRISEGISAIVSFIVIALYYYIIHIFDYRIKNKINFIIEEQIN